MSTVYEGRQIVGLDLHRRRSVLVRMTEAGEVLETTRISNDPEYLRQVMERAGERPEVVLEACYGWYWVADTLAELGASVHLAHPHEIVGIAHDPPVWQSLTSSSDASAGRTHHPVALPLRMQLLVEH